MSGAKTLAGKPAADFSLEFQENSTQNESSRLRPDRINIMESLILAQNERWRRVLSMQVERQSDRLSS